MTTMEPAVDLREPAGWRRSKNRIATALLDLFGHPSNREREVFSAGRPRR